MSSESIEEFWERKKKWIFLHGIEIATFFQSFFAKLNIVESVWPRWARWRGGSTTSTSPRTDSMGWKRWMAARGRGGTSYIALVSIKSVLNLPILQQSPPPYIYTNMWLVLVSNFYFSNINIILLKPSVIHLLLSHVITVFNILTGISSYNSIWRDI